MKTNFKTQSVLVVEDNADLRSLYVQIIELEGYRVLEAENGKIALEILKNKSEMPGLILLDLMMPIMDGWEFLKARASDSKFKNIPTVICSASKENLPTDVEVLTKPVDFNMLVALLRKIGEVKQ